MDAHAGMKIEEIVKGETYRCHSDFLGKIYTITYAGSGDADPEYVALWDCDCPARVTCKHIRALSAFLDQQYD